MTALLEVRDLSVVYESAGQVPVQAVDHVSFDIGAGEFVGLVGESGSGKSTLGFALTRLQKPPARTNGGSIRFDGHDIRELRTMTEQIAIMHGGLFVGYGQVDDVLNSPLHPYVAALAEVTRR